MPVRNAQTAPPADYRRKIMSPVDLANELERLRSAADKPSPRIVQCHGCFDIVHPGHIRYLQFARTLGDCLIVSITGDAAIDKGPARPFIPEELRAENLAALEFVDYVTIDPDPTAAGLLAQLRPDVYVKGREYATSTDPRFLEERRVVEAAGGSVVFSSGDVVFSSTRLLEHAPNDAGLARQRLESLCQRHDISVPALERAITAFAGLRVLVVGDVLIERFVLCDALESAAEAPIMNLRELDQRDHLGGAGLVATLAASLSARTTLVTSLGDDALSNWARNSLQASGVHVRAAARREGPVVRTRFLVDEQKLLRTQRGGPAPIDSRCQRDLAAAIRETAAQCDLCIMLDGGLGTISPGLLQDVAAPLRKQIACWTAGASDAALNRATWRDADLVCVSERRLRAALNDRDSGLSVLAKRMFDATRCRRMIATLGKGGLVAFRPPPTPSGRGDRLLSEHLPSLADRVVDRLGASESLLTVSSLATATGANDMQAAWLGSLAAAAQLSQMGPMLITADDLRGLAQSSVPVAAAGSVAPRHAIASRDQQQQERHVLQHA